MEYVVALVVTLASIVGLFVAIAALYGFSGDKEIVRASTISLFIFVITLFIGTSMLTAISG